jgi:hypothetical protein
MGGDMTTATHDIPGLITALANGPKLIIPIVRDTPPANLKRRPTPEKWSVHEHACHIATVHPLFFGRLDQMLRDKNPRVIPYEPGDEAPDMLLKMDLEASLERLVRERAEIVDRIRKLTPEQWERTGEHPEYDRYSVFIMFRHLELHDKLHAYRIEQLAYKPDW